MGTLSVYVSLSGMTPSNVVRPEDFIVPLNAEVAYPVVRVFPGGPRWRAGVVDFAVVSVSDYESTSDDPHGAFAGALATYLQEVAAWLLGRSKALSAMVDGGMKIVLVVVAKLDADQFEITIPRELVVAAAQSSLSLVMHSYE